MAEENTGVNALEEQPEVAKSPALNAVDANANVAMHKESTDPVGSTSASPALETAESGSKGEESRGVARVDEAPAKKPRRKSATSPAVAPPEAAPQNSTVMLQMPAGMAIPTPVTSVVTLQVAPPTTMASQVLSSNVTLQPSILPNGPTVTLQSTASGPQVASAGGKTPTTGAVPLAAVPAQGFAGAMHLTISNGEFSKHGLNNPSLFYLSVDMAHSLDSPLFLSDTFSKAFIKSDLNYL